jgi:tRNA-specific 2-thiouridylase
MKESLREIRGKRVVVGLSGGVDSAVTAAKLKREGAEVIGVFAKGWYPPGMPCTWAEDRRDAMRVAARLGIPFHTLDASAEYKKEVIDYMLAEFAAGRTPNPDVMCNRAVKFGALWKFAQSLGAEYLATGHYARTEVINGEAAILRGVDPEKDQSYFLWAVPKKVLSHVLFPLGGMRKDETRALARTWNLPVAAKRDSQGICFLGSISVEDFLRHEFNPEHGKAIDESGAEVGTHDGAILHTIGERVALLNAPQGPWYVRSKDIPENTLVVIKDLKNLGQFSTNTGGIALTQTNWQANSVPKTLTAQYRYHGPRLEGTLSDSHAVFTSAEIAEPLAAGQSLVLFDGERMVGGGIIAA